MAEYTDTGKLKAPPIEIWPDDCDWWAMSGFLGTGTFYHVKPEASRSGIWHDYWSWRQWESSRNKYNITDWQQSLTSRAEAEVG